MDSLTATVREQPPEWWGPTIGDVVHNVRSALDYAIWEQAAESSAISSESQAI